MPEIIRAAVLNTARGTLDIEELTLADPGPDEVLVRIRYAGLCHSDLHEIDGTFPTTLPILLGHEASGVVEKVGTRVSGIVPGDHVVTCLSVFCGHCRYCTDGRLTLCVHRRALAMAGVSGRLTNAAGTPVRPTAGIGAFAQKTVVHHSALAVIAEDMPLAQASILGCAVTTGVGAVTRRARVRPGSSVVVIGTGGIGMSAIQGARIAGAATIIAVDMVSEKLAAAQEFGATHVVHAGESDPVEQVLSLTCGGADYTFEAVGKARTVEQAVAMLAPGGVATVVGMVPADPPIRIDGTDLFYAEKTLQGSFMGSNQFKTDIGRFVELYRGGRLALDRMISHTVTLDEINSGFDALASGRSMRVIVDMEHP
ncbi:MAG: Zn-dependent alcohol dehydrogenase [Rhodococcus sp. (in: high G+C Gram-positive bacteria)]